MMDQQKLKFEDIFHTAPTDSFNGVEEMVLKLIEENNLLREKLYQTTVVIEQYCNQKLQEEMSKLNDAQTTQIQNLQLYIKQLNDGKEKLTPEPGNSSVNTLMEKHENLPELVELLKNKLENTERINRKINYEVNRLNVIKKDLELQLRQYENIVKNHDIVVPFKNDDFKNMTVIIEDCPSIDSERDLLKKLISDYKKLTNYCKINCIKLSSNKTLVINSKNNEKKSEINDDYAKEIASLRSNLKELEEKKYLSELQMQVYYKDFNEERICRQNLAAEKDNLSAQVEALRLLLRKHNINDDNCLLYGNKIKEYYCINTDCAEKFNSVEQLEKHISQCFKFSR